MEEIICSKYSTTASDNSSEENYENGYSQSANYPKKNLIKSDERKFKTEICKNWLEKGKCNYGNRCRFAHGK